MDTDENHEAWMYNNGRRKLNRLNESGINLAIMALRESGYSFGLLDSINLKSVMRETTTTKELRTTPLIPKSNITTTDPPTRISTKHDSLEPKSIPSKGAFQKSAIQERTFAAITEAKRWMLRSTKSLETKQRHLQSTSGIECRSFAFPVVSVDTTELVKKRAVCYLFMISAIISLGLVGTVL